MTPAAARAVVAEPRLRWAGALLALGELFCVGRFWQARADNLIAEGAEALCWPMWPDCASWRVLGQPALTGALVGLTVLAVLTVIAFVRRAPASLLLLAVTMLCILGLEAQDFRFRQPAILPPRSRRPRT